MCHRANFRKRLSLRLGSILILIVGFQFDVSAKPSNSDKAKNTQFKFARFSFSEPFVSSTDAVQGITREYRIHYAFAGDESKPGVIFIHGTPGSWTAFSNYLANTSLQQDFFMISVDRMGWGQSSLGKQKIDGRFRLQAESIAAIAREYPDKTWTIVGHSLGASIAPKIALIEPKSVNSLLLLAGSLNPKLGRPRWYNRIASTWVVSRLIGKSMRNSNREIMALKSELGAMHAELKQHQLKANLVIMQGKKDKLVSNKNPDFAATHWQSSFSNIRLIELANEGHFLPWRQSSLVIETLYSLTHTAY